MRALFSVDYIHVDVSDQFSPFGKLSILGIYILFRLFLAFPKYFFRVHHRPTIALCCSMCMIIWRSYLCNSNVEGPGVTSAPDLEVKRKIFLEPLVFLFGSSLLVTTTMRQMEVLDVEGQILRTIKQKTGAGFLSRLAWTIKLAVLSTVSSAVLSNEGTAALLSESILHSSGSVSPPSNHPINEPTHLVLGLTVFLNAGAVLAYTGSMHNIIILALMYDKVGWLEFVKNMLLPFGLTVTIYCILFSCCECMDNIGTSGNEYGGIAGDEQNTDGGFPLEIDNGGGAHSNDEAENNSEDDEQPAENNEGRAGREKRLRWFIAQLLVVGTATLLCYAKGFDVCVTLVGIGSIFLILVSWQIRRSETEHNEEIGVGIGNTSQHHERDTVTTGVKSILADVDYSRIVFFVGEFIVVGSLSDTGIPQALLSLLLGPCAEQITSDPVCLLRFTTVIALLTNVVSSTSLCIMLAATFPYATPYDWVQTAFIITIAGNFLGSALVFPAGFPWRTRIMFGFPTTFVCLFLGAYVISIVHYSPKCSEKLGECVTR